MPSACLAVAMCQPVSLSRPHVTARSCLIGMSAWFYGPLGVDIVFVQPYLPTRLRVRR